MDFGYISCIILELSAKIVIQGEKQNSYTPQAAKIAAANSVAASSWLKTQDAVP